MAFARASAGASGGICSNPSRRVQTTIPHSAGGVRSQMVAPPWRLRCALRGYIQAAATTLAAGDHCGPGSRGQHGGQDLHRRTFARSVRTDQGGGLPPPGLHLINAGAISATPSGVGPGRTPKAPHGLSDWVKFEENCPSPRTQFSPVECNRRRLAGPVSAAIGDREVECG